MRLLSPTTANRPNPDRPRAQVIRCACTVCGTHTNALTTIRVAGSCSNCGSFDLVPIEGAEPLGGPLAA